MNYNFHAILEPLEFQKLVCDIVESREKIDIETYKEGRDSGIDGAYSSTDKRIIVQAKRYQDYKLLYRDLQKKELHKVKKLDPSRYILGVSMDFTPMQKEEITQLFEGYIIATNDILSNNDINRFLEKPEHKWIELSYPKLWLPSIPVFENILHQTVNRALYNESKEELKEAIKASNVFVSTRIYRQALELLSMNHVIILSGEPGVGKTTMANLLALAFLQPANLSGYVWVNSIENIYSMFNDDQQQVFIMDDFWGSIFHTVFHHQNDERRLEKLIRRIIESNGKKRLILTTREYILQQGLQKHPALKEIVVSYGLNCTVEEYGYDEKASIFFSHLYTSNLEYEYVTYLFNHCSYIICHENYNPRVMALFLQKQPDANCDPEDYFDQLCDYFDHPGALWESVFVRLSDEAKVIALILLISSTPMRLSDMEICYQKYIQNSSNRLNVKKIGDCISELEKTMIKSFYSENEDKIMLKFIMPAVQDYLYSYIEEGCEQVIPIFIHSCAFFNQITFVLRHFAKHCSSNVFDQIVQQCIEHYEDFPDSFVEHDGSWLWDDDDYDRWQLSRFSDLLRCYEDIPRPNLYNFLKEIIENFCLSMGEDDPEAQYIDLQNLPNIIGRCAKIGMTFSGGKIISSFYSSAFSVYHLIEMKKFADIFPADYMTFHESNNETMIKNIKNTICSEIDFLIDYCMDYQLDLLVENMPNLLKEFGLLYTDNFEQQIISLSGITPIHSQKNKNTSPWRSSKKSNKKREAYEEVKDEAENWLFGPGEEYIDDVQIKGILQKSELRWTVKKELLKLLSYSSPCDIYSFMCTKESLLLLIDAFVQNNIVHIPDKEIDIYCLILDYIVKSDKALMGKLVFFCAEVCSLFMYRKEPIVRVNQFVASETYKVYLEDDIVLQDIVYKFLVKKDDQWIRFLHVPLFLASFLLFKKAGKAFGYEDDYYSDLWGENFSKLRHRVSDKGVVTKHIYYADIGFYHFRNYEWEACMYRLAREIDPHYFMNTYVAPKIKDYLDDLGGGDDESKVKQHLSICKAQVQYTKRGKISTSNYEMCDEICMIEYLSLAECWDNYFGHIDKIDLDLLKADKTICSLVDGEWNINVYRINDISILSKLGIYQETLSFIKQLEKLYDYLTSTDSNVDISHPM